MVKLWQLVGYYQTAMLIWNNTRSWRNENVILELALRRVVVKLWQLVWQYQIAWCQFGTICKRYYHKQKYWKDNSGFGTRLWSSGDSWWDSIRQPSANLELTCVVWSDSGPDLNFGHTITISSSWAGTYETSIIKIKINILSLSRISQGDPRPCYVMTFLELNFRNHSTN